MYICLLNTFAQCYYGPFDNSLKAVQSVYMYDFYSLVELTTYLNHLLILLLIYYVKAMVPNSTCTMDHL